MTSRSGYLAIDLLMTYRILGDPRVAAWFAFSAIRPLRASTANAKARTHKLLTGIARHASSLRVAILHSLLLRRELGACWQSDGNCQQDRDE